MNRYKFTCGCSVRILSEESKSYKLKIDYDEILYDLNYKPGCSKVYDMLAEGKTKGVFQLEGYLGKTWAQRIQPSNIEEIAALVALIRPSCLQSISDKGKSMTQHYADRKHKIEPDTPVHPSLEKILSDTHQILIFQEQNIAIVKELAGFNDEEAETLRKAIGQKLADVMAKVKIQFLEGCKKVGIVGQADAEKIFSWIQEAQRYQFNLAHACSYGQIGYLTAFTKYHFPIQFFASYLTYAKDKLDHVKEIKELIDEAKKFNIPVLTPKLSTLFNDDCNVAIDDKKLRFGLKSMKSFGNSSIDKFKKVFHDYENRFGSLDQWGWNKILYFLLPNINSQSVNALITGGVLDELNINRSQMLLEYQKVKELSKKQLETLREIDLPLEEALPKLEEKVNKGQKQKISDLHKLICKSTHSMTDRPAWIVSTEKDIYGVPVTYNPIDVLKYGSNANTTCKEFLDGKDGSLIIAGELQNVKAFKIKTGKNTGKMMAKASLDDGTAIIDCVLFQKNYDQYSSIMYDGNLVCIDGKRSDSNSLIIDSMQEVF